MDPLEGRKTAAPDSENPDRDSFYQNGLSSNGSYVKQIKMSGTNKILRRKDSMTKFQRNQKRKMSRVKVKRGTRKFTKLKGGESLNNSISSKHDLLSPKNKNTIKGSIHGSGSNENDE